MKEDNYVDIKDCLILFRTFTFSFINKINKTPSGNIEKSFLYKKKEINIYFPMDIKRFRKNLNLFVKNSQKELNILKRKNKNYYCYSIKTNIQESYSLGDHLKICVFFAIRASKDY